MVFVRVPASQAISSVAVEERTLPQYFEHGESGAIRRAAASGADMTAATARRAVVSRILAVSFLHCQTSRDVLILDGTVVGGVPQSTLQTGSRDDDVCSCMRGTQHCSSGRTFIAAQVLGTT